TQLAECSCKRKPLQYQVSRGNAEIILMGTKSSAMNRKKEKELPNKALSLESLQEYLYAWDRTGLQLFDKSTHHEEAHRILRRSGEYADWLANVAVSWDTVYILGIWDGTASGNRSLYEVKICGSKIAASAKADCPNSHYECGCVALRSEGGRVNIYIIGGYTSSAILGKCDRYSVATNKWHALPSLKVPRVALGACAVNSRLIYTFNGWDGDSSVSTVEKFDALDEDGGWKNVILSHGCWGINARVAAAQISADKILVFGSMYYTSGTYEWNFADASAERVEVMMRGADLDCRKPGWTEGGRLGIIDWKGLVHQYSTIQRKWRLSWGNAGRRDGKVQAEESLSRWATPGIYL
ncbi:MAG: kelch repeat-containing protein, partial [Negativicutes bacterium]|nr:kelch repeat-containing protein [Negativicutes bacterium]